ncbi:hypothetical protein RND81_01G018100 [Saponaria officinalis]|uniref:Uncharacterized protein n=1 Tax=Saponaria officinalis TaxID=3572 RepID=A0AAW1N5K6_SAPOF
MVFGLIWLLYANGQYNDTISQDRPADAWADKTPNLTSTTLSQTLTDDDISLPYKREYYFDREPDLESKLTRSGVSLYGSDPAIGSLHSTGLTRSAAPIVTQEFSGPELILCSFITSYKD